MPIPTSHHDLTALFARLGARAPDSWAESQLREGIPQLQRFVFLRQAWRQVCPDGDSNWIHEQVKTAELRPSAPFADAGLIMKKCMSAGVSVEDLVALTRALQAQVLFQISYLLDDPQLEEPELSELHWGLFEVDHDGKPTQRIGALHESVLETDPSGREMRPKR
jgi:hypothetical protein